MRVVQVYVVGTGGAGRETLDVALACGVVPAGFLDDRPGQTLVRDLPVSLPDEADAGARFVVGIADADARRGLAARLQARGLEPLTLVHPSAVVAPVTRLGSGCVVMALAHVSSDVVVGDHVHIQYTATVGHDTVIEDFVTVLPGANISGAVRLGEGCTVGTGAAVLQGRVVGAGAFVGAGAVVTRDVAAGAVVVGAPARPLR